MQLLIYYQQIAARLGQQGENTDIPITLEELSDLLISSLRNIRLIIKKMEGEGWIKWTSGRGRGNHSKIRLLIPVDELIVREMEPYLARGNLKEVMELMRLPEISESVKTYFSEWIADSFGFKEVLENEKKLDVLRFPIFRNLTTLDPIDVLYTIDHHMVHQIFDTLVCYDAEQRKVIPHVALHWEANADSSVWTFYLRKGIRFHHGSELQARDVAFTLSRLKYRTTSTPNGWIGDQIHEIRILGPYVIQIQLNQTNQMFHRYMAALATSIVCEDLYNGDLDVSIRVPIGTGPYRVNHFDTYNCKLEAFADYFNGRAQLDQIDIWYLPEKSLYPIEQRKEMHVLVSHHNPIALPTSQWKAETKMETGCTIISYNMNKQGPHLNSKFRRAVHHIINRKAMAEHVYRSLAIPASGFVAAETTCQPPEDDYQPEHALQLLKSIDYASEPFTMYVTPWHEPAGRWVQQQCAEYGIPLELTVLTGAEMSLPEQLLQADCVLIGVTSYDDVDIALLDTYLSPYSVNYVHLTDATRAQISRQVSEMLEEPLHDGHIKRIQELEAIIKHSYQTLFLHHRTQQTVFKSSIRGITLNSLGWIDFKQLWFQPTLRSGEVYRAVN
ncbi:ABC transporter substrate-binding protein [Paenibacillus sp. N1-5-1-14]|uniref:ABC transporter substrate-binding protein n=1 Tax=Paenibacillus radicibacter TaxID=2972488 RepID=UPI0021593FB2|nr:ABC transporter substrate-binding protein [Paenibacillus radicibacter]MCR8641210.1 ABC transporter substrate-binding protein [Paenibacillus radicibacter]